MATKLAFGLRWGLYFGTARSRLGRGIKKCRSTGGHVGNGETVMWKVAIVREIALVLLIKLSALWVIWFAFFHQPDRQEPDAHDVGRMLLGEVRSERDASFHQQQ
jgi:hypothetical protein